MRKLTHWLYAALILSLAASAMAQQSQRGDRTPPAEYTSRMEVLQDEALRQDFIVQGEYLATVEGQKVGLHLIADGGGKFRVVGYLGGLPGDGWKAGEPRGLGTAELNGEEITFKMTEQRNPAPNINMAVGEAKGTITISTPQRGQGQGGTGTGQFRGAQQVRIEIAAAGDRPALAFEKQNRRSQTFNLAAPEGAIVIFDGTNVDKFLPGARINEAQQQRAGGAGGGNAAGQQRPGGFGVGNTLWSEAATSAFEKKPYKMHIEFMLSFMPQARGQARSNSGVYIDERYECQVLDSFGLEGENNECGGFYQNSKPLVNMCFPPLAWQTYDFEFYPAKYDGNQKTTNARITVLHNGVVIHDNLELPSHTPGRVAEGPEPRGVYLQGHGNKVQYRNIWIQYLPEPVAQAEPVKADVPAQPAVEDVVKAEAATEEGNAVPVQSVRRGAATPRPLFPRLRALIQ